MLAIVGSACTIDIEASNNLGDRIIKSEYNLNVTSRILTCNGDGILSPDRGCLLENTIFDAPLDLLDFLQRLLLAEAVKEEVDITGGSEMLMIVFSEASLTTSPLKDFRVSSHSMRNGTRRLLNMPFQGQEEVR